MRTLKDRVAVVTGGNGGIGRATAVALADAGAHVALVDFRLDGIDEVVDRIQQIGRRVSVHQVDVSNRADVAALPAAVRAQHGDVHVLVNNAGVTATTPFVEQSEEDFDWVMNINLGGVVHCTRAFLPHIIQVPEAHIVNVSSIFGVVGVPAQVAYCTSKFAVRGFTEALAEELSGTSVGVTVVHPGGVNTGIIRNARFDDNSMKSNMEGFFQKNTISPDVVGEGIVDCILRNRARFLVAPEAHVFDLLKRMFPTWGNRFAVRQMVQAMGMKTALEDRQKAILADVRKT